MRSPVAMAVCLWGLKYQVFCLSRFRGLTARDSAILESLGSVGPLRSAGRVANTARLHSERIACRMHS